MVRTKKIYVKYVPSIEQIKVRSVSVKELNMKDYTQELLANLVEAVVDMYELKNGDMSMEQGAELVRIGDRLAKVLEEFIEDNK